MVLYNDELLALGRLNGSNLTVMDFYESSLSDLGVQRLCKGNPNLKHLCLRSGDSHLEFADATIQSIVTNCPKIETLSLDGWFYITAESMVYLSQLQCLREINLFDCRSLTSAAVQSLLRANQRLVGLIFCDDSDEEYDHEPSLVDSTLLTCIGSNCPKLTKLMFALPETSDVTDASLTDMLRGCPLLEELRFAEFRKPNTLLPTLGACCRRLRRLYLRSVILADDDMVALCQGCPDLLSLRLPECQGIGDAAVNAIASHYKKLQELLLTENDTITDQSMCALFSSCTGLRSIHLSRLVLLTSASVLALLYNCPLLKSLSLHWKYSLINDLIAASTEPEAAELVKLQAITDETLAQIPICCKELKTFCLSHCNFISKDGVCTLIDSCKRLTECTVHNCKQAKPSPECWARVKGVRKRYRGLKIRWC